MILFRMIGLVVGSLMMLASIFFGGLIPFFAVLLGIIVFVFSAIGPDRGSLKVISSGVGIILLSLFLFRPTIILGWVVMVIGAFMPSY
jgi:hypothetical protein